MSKKNIDFSGDPILGYTSQPKTTSEDSAPAAQERVKEEPNTSKVEKTIESAPAGYRVNPKFIPKRTFRLQLLIPDSLAKDLKKRAKQSNISVNEICNQILNNFLYE